MSDVSVIQLAPVVRRACDESLSLPVKSHTCVNAAAAMGTKRDRS